MKPAPIDAGSLSRTRERVRVRARELRQASPDAERAIWRRLRNRQLGGWNQHFEPNAVLADDLRTRNLRQQGFTVLRFSNREALTETDAVLQAIANWLAAHHPHPNPLPPAGEGASLLARPGEFVELSKD